MRKSFSIICCLLLSVLCRAQLSDSARIALLTCSPGKAVYLHYGHSALCVQDPVNSIDIVFNYGIFDFTAPHFYWRFCKGETYYQLAAQSTRSFVWQSNADGRTVSVQWLNLTASQRDSLYQALLINYLPENRVYLYNFVFDNCATRPYNLIKKSIGNIVLSGHNEHLPTYREAIQHYTPRGSWADLGINLIFGPASDKIMTAEQSLFLPEYLMHAIERATFDDGTALVTESYYEPFIIRPLPWYQTWYFGVGVWFLLFCLLSIYDRRRQKRSRWADIFMYCIYGTLLAIVVFLTFFTLHPLCGFSAWLLLLPSLHATARAIYFWK